MNENGIIRSVAITAISGLFAVASWAGDGPPQRGGRPEPPPEAVEACAGKSEGTTVEFTLRDDRKVNGICREIGGRMVAMPDGPPPRPNGNGQEKTTYDN